MAQLQVNGTQLEVQVSGDGPPLLFIHGLGSCLEDWEYQVEEFSRSYKVITYDLRGHGRSARPAGPYSIAMFADDAACVLQALNIPSAHVVGVSLGGAIAFQLALDHPSRVKTLVVVNSGPEAIARTLKEKFGVWMRNVIVEKMGIAKLGKTIGPKLFPRPEHRTLCDTFIERFTRNDAQAYLHAFRALIGWSVNDRISTIACPVLAIAADRDYTPLAFKEAYVAKIAGAKLTVVEDSHHALPMERPRQFNTALTSFLVGAH